MADDRPQDMAGMAGDASGDRPEEVRDDPAAAPELGRLRRPPPTIDFDAAEISGETADAEGKPEAPPPPEPDHEPPRFEQMAATDPNPESARASAISPWVVAPVSGAVAAALVIGVGWMLGWPAVEPAAPAAPQVSSAAIDSLSARVAGLESKIQSGAGKPVNAAPDAALTARVTALEKSQAALRDEVAATGAQAAKLATAVEGIKSAAGGAAATADLSDINARLDKLERASGAEKAEIAQASAKAAADDAPLRRMMVASLLDVSVRQGDPFTTTLATAKSLGFDAGALKPLEGFAATGVPTATTLSRELLTLVPRLSPKPSEQVAAGTSLVDRLEAGAARLVRIERTDPTGTDRSAVVARVTAAALRNDVKEARRELDTLSPAERAPVQGWIDKADARDTALAAARQFAADAMAALAKPSQ